MSHYILHSERIDNAYVSIKRFNTQSAFFGLLSGCVNLGAFKG